MTERINIRYVQIQDASFDLNGGPGAGREHGGVPRRCLLLIRVFWR
ncbi:hypothetical protein [Nonomuraea sp. NPDC049758]